MSGETGVIFRSAAWPATIIVVTTVLVAAGVEVTCASAARGWLRFGFAGVPGTLGEALGIFAANARLLVAVGVATLTAQLRLRDEAHSKEPGALRVLSRVCDLALFVAALVNIGIVGLSIGAYGWRMCVAILPHGPVELSAYSVALGFYRHARRWRISRQTALSAAAGATGLLALAALLETFAWLG
jgi:hypothetical protein